MICVRMRRQVERGCSSRGKDRPDICHIPSSGSIVRVKLRISSTSGKCIFMVDGNDNSVISGMR